MSHGLLSISGSLAMLATMRRASSRVRLITRLRCDAAIMSGIGGSAEVRDLRLKDVDAE